MGVKADVLQEGERAPGGGGGGASAVGWPGGVCRKVRVVMASQLHAACQEGHQAVGQGGMYWCSCTSLLLHTTVMP
jgi:hypothetical protein